MKVNSGYFRFFAIGLASVWLALFVFFPNLLVVITSLLTRDPSATVSLPFNLNSYWRTLDVLYLDVLWNSIKMAALATISCLLIGFPFAMAIVSLPKRWQTIALFFMIVPFWTNSLVRTYAIQFILGNQGIINKSLLALGLIDTPLQLLYTPFAVILGLCYILIPFMVLPLYSALEKLDPRLHFAARDLGASAFHRFIKITLPLTSPGIVAGCLMVLLPAMGMFYISDLLGGAKNLLLGNVIKTQFLNTRDWPFGSAFSVMLMMLLGVMLWLYYRASRFTNKQGGIHDSNF
ncbi:spermidine/putrescine ABC transporter permease PotB [Gilvimarinus algae]|uniref:Spermidine/putrescine ABC transporter permease PotB n=1 Tax=Gilvimarinus algae TaxID=3058037 RepID=A0ABT8TAK7_9GAMM|nr:spermidine/putrescine ABC transporter permease PotB [Gilvimarinus sp. SDUM040014]MDO3381151.1 spermidine/putrescine ABC transporter permease PotB [Gilvimarinus sp. SDUM040014]